jgi:flagellar biosynthesis chaperone FliJ
VVGDTPHPLPKENEMNNDRRKELQKILDQLNTIEDELNQIKDDEQNYQDSIPENMQRSNNAQISESAIDNLDSAISDIGSVISYVESAME